MADVLKKIIETKKTEVAQLKADMSLHELHHQAAAAPAPAGFAAALKAASVSGYGLIAELKKASPSKGLIRACLLYTSPSPRDRTRSRMPSSA